MLEAVMFRDRARGFSLLLAATASVAAVVQTAKPAPIRQMRANGVNLSYVDQGQGTPVVFVHGAAGDLRYWEPQRTAFVTQHRFVAYSYRYHGTGPWPDDGKQYSVGTHAADLTAFLAALKGGPVHLVGLSYGGLLAAMVAIREPQLVRTLTLAEPALFSLLGERPEDRSVLEEWNKGFEPISEAIMAGDHVRAMRYLSGLVTGGGPETFDRMPAALREVLLDNARTLPLLLAAPPQQVTCELLRGIKAPTLVVRGERTPKVFVRTNDEAGRCIAGSRQVVIPKASHPMSFDNPAEFNRAVLEFLAQTSARRAPAVQVIDGSSGPDPEGP
jgi:pimeloyl-ACP methyl ester carboxylesterase